MSGKIYSFQSKIYPVEGKGGAYTIFPFDVREAFGKGRAKVHVTFDGYPYDGSVVNMGVKKKMAVFVISLALEKIFKKQSENQSEIL